MGDGKVSDLEFELTVTQRKPNPDYQEPRVGFYQNAGVPQFIEERTLYVVLTRDEFNAVRLACVSRMFEGAP